MYGLAKVHESETPQDHYYHFWASLNFCDNNDGAKIETNGKDELNGNSALDLDETIISLDAKSLYTKDPLKEAINNALQKLCSQDSPPKIQRATLKIV